MTVRSFTLAAIFDIEQRPDGFYYKQLTPKDNWEGPFDTIAALSKHIAELIDRSLRSAYPAE
jgi:hypothetical protein